MGASYQLLTGRLRRQKDKKEIFGDTPNPGKGCASALPFGSPTAAIGFLGPLFAPAKAVPLHSRL